MAVSPRKAPKAAPAKSKGSTMQPLLWVLLLSIVMFAFPESIILLFIGLLPTLVAFIIDKSSKKYSTFCVGAMNITGVFPSLLELWAGQNTIGHAIQIITNVFDLIVMYAAASFGWLLYIAIPPVVNALLAVVAQHRITQLRSRQRELIGEWGEDITSRPRNTEMLAKGRQNAPPSAPPADEPELDIINATPPAPS
ncbi:MAG: hypothetical protein HON14_07630 [Rhodospirillaceae bacterium]|jgi:hypothetical protein|nr:hypothetical protein [Rhodospirillaceae bacterium]MBT4588778.1 hypothetical protein [Rhodospirillaceae bacterium]MBT4938986.1 hypothetical protein [Rhodospirillaceae bacterium]MBT5940177.1 hypothetical protein [Rhodospirillaceae bacterium]MBT7267751.1 hypothetical protein [Rhodospirillaceae bacterium]